MSGYVLWTSWPSGHSTSVPFAKFGDALRALAADLKEPKGDRLVRVIGEGYDGGEPVSTGLTDWENEFADLVGEGEDPAEFCCEVCGDPDEDGEDLKHVDEEGESPRMCSGCRSDCYARIAMTEHDLL